MDATITKIVNEKIMPPEIQRLTKKEQKWCEFKYTDPIRINVTKFVTKYFEMKFKAQLSGGSYDTFA